jgi:hypothetical protein
MEPITMKINEVEYVRKDSLNNEAVKLDGMPYVIVRTYSAGVFAGYLQSRKEREVCLRQAKEKFGNLGTEQPLCLS